jgi:hypothetical protein
MPGGCTQLHDQQHGSHTYGLCGAMALFWSV